MPANQTQQRFTSLPAVDTSPPIVPHQSSSLGWTCWPPSPSCPPCPPPAPTTRATPPSDRLGWTCAALATCRPTLQSARTQTAETLPVPLPATTPTWPDWASRQGSLQATSSSSRATSCTRRPPWGYQAAPGWRTPPPRPPPSPPPSPSWPPTPSCWGRGEPSELQATPVPCPRLLPLATLLTPSPATPVLSPPASGPCPGLLLTSPSCRLTSRPSEPWRPPTRWLSTASSGDDCEQSHWKYWRDFVSWRLPELSDSYQRGFSCFHDSSCVLCCKVSSCLGLSLDFK